MSKLKKIMSKPDGIANHKGNNEFPLTKRGWTSKAYHGANIRANIGGITQLGRI